MLYKQRSKYAGGVYSLPRIGGSHNPTFHTKRPQAIMYIYIYSHIISFSFLTPETKKSHSASYHRKPRKEVEDFFFFDSN